MAGMMQSPSTIGHSVNETERDNGVCIFTSDSLVLAQAEMRLVATQERVNAESCEPLVARCAMARLAERALTRQPGAPGVYQQIFYGPVNFGASQNVVGDSRVAAGSRSAGGNQRIVVHPDAKQGPTPAQSVWFVIKKLCNQAIRWWVGGKR